MKKLKLIVPKYAYVPLLLAVLLNMIVYNGSKLITNQFFHYDFSTIVDSFIPFWSIFILVYILAYVQWIVGYIVISREDKETCYYYMIAEVIAKLFCLFFFFIIPSTIVRPAVLGNGILDTLTKFIYSMDEPVNLFPSIHCLESWMCFRGSMHLKSVSKTYKWGMFVFSILVFLSTVFVKQHVFVDIIGGILVVELGLYLAKKWNAKVFFEKINAKIIKNS